MLSMKNFHTTDLFLVSPYVMFLHLIDYADFQGLRIVRNSTFSR